MVDVPFHLGRSASLLQQSVPRKGKLDLAASVTSKKSPNAYKSYPKMISLEKLKILAHLQKLSKNVGDFVK